MRLSATDDRLAFHLFWRRIARENTVQTFFRNRPPTTGTIGGYAKEQAIQVRMLVCWHHVRSDGR